MTRLSYRPKGTATSVTGSPTMVESRCREDCSSTCITSSSALRQSMWLHPWLPTDMPASRSWVTAASSR